MNSDPYDVGPATADEVDTLASIWHDGWRDGHLGSVPDDLLAHRTAEEFLRRTTARVHEMVAARSDGSVAGFFLVVDDELEQIYVHRGHRGKGVAQLLLNSAEATIAQHHDDAWLAVVAGNARAQRFYEKQGWRDTGIFNYQAEGIAGPVTVPSHRFVKSLAAHR